MDYIKLFLTYLIRAFFRIFCLIPIKKNRVVLNSSHWEQYSCNPKYITEGLLGKYPEKFEIIWCFNEPGKFKFLEEKGITICRARGLMHYFYHLTASVIISNNGVGGEIPHRNGQYRINTWHGGGGGYKKMDFKNTLFRAKLERKETDLYCASSETSLKNTVRIALGHKGDVFKGTPRNDMLLNNFDSQYRQDVIQTLNLYGDEKIVLYAPTFREGKNALIYDLKKYDYGLDFMKLHTAVEKRFGGKWIVAVRFHPKIKCYKLPVSEYVVDATHYPDMQELLSSVDALVTDYSSSLWDFSFTYKPCFLFCEDLEEYKSKRGFNKPIEEWGFPIAKNNSELEQIILNWDEDTHRRNMDIQHQINGSFEDGTATDRMVELIYRKCFEDRK